MVLSILVRPFFLTAGKSIPAVYIFVAMRIVFLLIVLNSMHVKAQELDINSKTIQLGNQHIEIVEYNKNSPEKTVYINVHEDEETSISAILACMEVKPLHFIYLKHVKTRRIEFKVKKKLYSIDPNRIYTNKGRKETLKAEGNYSAKAKKIAKKLAKEILAYLPKDHVVVAVHNNSDVEYTIKSYLPGEEEAENTAEVYISTEMDADDFIYTTEKKYFEYLKARDVNVILQDNENCVNDGSLSVYCGKKNIPYINIEVELGKLTVQLEMIRIIEEMLMAK